MSMKRPRPEGDPLFGQRPIEHLRADLGFKAFVHARRHLYDKHGLTTAQLRGANARVVLGWHLSAHGLAAYTPFDAAAIPWGLVSTVHRIAERAEEAEAT